MVKHLGFTEFKLADLATVRSGYAARTELKKNDHFGTRILQLRDVDADGFYNYETLQRVEADLEIASKYFAMPNNVVIANRGERLKASSIQEEENELIISGNFFILDVNQSIVASKYLAFYLNQETSQQTLSNRTEGTSLRQLKAKELEMLPVWVPDLENQLKLIKLCELNKLHKTLFTKMQSKMDLLINNLVGLRLENS